MPLNKEPPLHPTPPKETDFFFSTVSLQFPFFAGENMKPSNIFTVID